MITLDKKCLPDAVRGADADDPTSPLMFVVYRENVHPLKPAQLRLAALVEKYGVKCVVEYRGRLISFTDWAEGRIVSATFTVSTITNRKSKLRTCIQYVLANPTDPHIDKWKEEIDRQLTLLPEKDRVELLEMFEKNDKLKDSDAELDRLAEMAEKGKQLREQPEKENTTNDHLKVDGPNN